MMLCGLEVFRKDPSLGKDWGRCGLVCNQASVAGDFTPAWRVLHEALGKRLVALFGPQHGFESTVQENMIESSHGKHQPTGLPVYSLYSETRQPTPEMLRGVDTIVVDLPVIGTRIYTYKYTTAACLRAAKKLGKRVVVLDRTNPLGGEVLEGRVLETGLESFVGEFSIPMRHGLTIGEAARFFNHTIGAELQVISLQNWDARKLRTSADQSWVLTSPNIPTLDSVYVFPGTVLFEGTNVSEGRGTCLPFQFIGAPYLRDSEKFVARTRELAKEYGAGVFLRPTVFQPAFHKWVGEVCQGFQIHVLEPEKIRSFKLSLAILRACLDLGEGNFAWRQPPYEYEYVKPPILTLSGSHDFIKRITAGDFSVNDPYWVDGIAKYIEHIKPFLLYKRPMSCE